MSQSIEGKRTFQIVGLWVPPVSKLAVNVSIAETDDERVKIALYLSEGRKLKNATEMTMLQGWCFQPLILGNCVDSVVQTRVHGTDAVAISNPFCGEIPVEDAFQEFCKWINLSYFACPRVASPRGGVNTLARDLIEGALRLFRHVGHLEWHTPMSTRVRGRGGDVTQMTPFQLSIHCGTRWNNEPLETLLEMRDEMEVDLSRQEFLLQCFDEITAIRRPRHLPWMGTVKFFLDRIHDHNLQRAYLTWCKRERYYRLIGAYNHAIKILRAFVDRAYASRGEHCDVFANCLWESYMGTSVASLSATEGHRAATAEILYIVVKIGKERVAMRQMLFDTLRDSVLQFKSIPVVSQTITEYVLSSNDNSYETKITLNIKQFLEIYLPSPRHRVRSLFPELVTSKRAQDTAEDDSQPKQSKRQRV